MAVAGRVAVVVTVFPPDCVPPTSRESPWVRKEVSWWLTNRSPRQFLIILARATWHGMNSSAISTGVEQAHCWRYETRLFEAEPLYVDLRWAKTYVELSLRNSKFREAVLPLAAKLHGVEPQDLDGEDLKQFRRTRRFWRSAVLGLIALTLASVIAAVIAKLKSDEAIEQAKIALSQKLAVNSARQQDADIDLALLLAREAYLIHPTKGGTHQSAFRFAPRKTAAIRCLRSQRTFFLLRSGAGRWEEARTSRFAPQGWGDWLCNARTRWKVLGGR